MNINDVKIPDNLMENLEKRLRVHVQKKKKRRNMYVLMSIIAILIVPSAVFAYNSYFTTYKFRPWAPKDSTNYVQTINQNAKDNGIQVELNSILTDDVGLDIGMVIRTSKDIGNYTGPFLLKGDIRVNGKNESSIIHNIGYMFFDRTGQNEYSGVINKEISNLPDQFALEFSIKEIAMIKDGLEISVGRGNWLLSTNVTKTAIDQKTLKAKPNIIKTFAEGNIRISKVIATPLALKVFANENNLKGKYSFFAIDDKGRELLQIGNSFEQYTDNEGKLVSTEVFDYVPLKEPPRSITLIPCASKEVYSEKSIDLKDIKPSMEFNCGDLGKLIIKDINKNGSYVKISLRAEGLLPYTLAFPTTYILENETASRKADCIRTVLDKAGTPENAVDFELEFNDYDSTKTYSLHYNSGMQVYKNEAVTINLQ